MRIKKLTQIVLKKTKPNKTVSEDFKRKVRTVFHHLTKEELIEKVLADYLANANSKISKVDVVKKKKRK